MTAPAVPPTGPAVDPLGDAIGDGLAGAIGSGIDTLMQAIWEGCLWLLRESFTLVDALSTFTVDPSSGSIGPVWSVLVWVSSAIALGLFFWQLSLAVLRGGRGLGRAATGPFAYGIALAVTAGVVALAVEGADGLTTLLLEQGLRADNFSAAFTSTTLGQGATNGIKAVALGLIGFFGLLPAALGYTLEVIWRQAAILVLVATVPITAAGMLAQTTSSWFWKTCRWITAAIVVKPALALILVVGFSVLANTQGPAGILAGVGVMWVSLTAPLALYRLLAFIDPGTDAGGAFRTQLSGMASRLTGDIGSRIGGSHDGYADFHDYRPGGPGSPSGGIGAFDDANTARFDAAAPPDAEPTVAPPLPPTPPAAAAQPDNPAPQAPASGPVDDSTPERGSGASTAGRAGGTGEGGAAAAGAADTAVIL